MFDHLAHTEVEVTWSAYQRMLRVYRDTDRSRAAGTLRALIRTDADERAPRVGRATPPGPHP